MFSRFWLYKNFIRKLIRRKNNDMKKALVTGITGQDGSYLAELLLEKGYEVHGIIRRSSVNKLDRLEHIVSSSSNIYLHYGDLTDTSSITSILAKVKPDEVYNLAAQSHVHVSFSNPEYTADVDGVGTLRILEAIRTLGLNSKFYQASTSELYGKIQEVPQTENTVFYPRSPYGVAKLYAYWITKNYRESYNMFACSGILFNHESPRRGEEFVTQKIVLGLKAIIDGKQEVLELGNLEAKRDWGHAKDYVEAMWLMLQQESPQDYVISSGEEYTVKSFVEKSAKHFGMDILWSGNGVDEIGTDNNTGKIVVRVNAEFFRPAEVDRLIGDSTKARKELGWKQKISFDELVSDMCNAVI
jgi:GDPmannose 4,6-dehydratase